MEIREHKVVVTQPRFNMNVILTCDGECPGFAVDRDIITEWVNNHAEILNAEPYDHICRITAMQFPRVITVEVCDPEDGSGVVIHPWTGA
jgi:hypothetical protein